MGLSTSWSAITIFLESGWSTARNNREARVSRNRTYYADDILIRGHFLDILEAADKRNHSSVKKTSRNGYVNLFSSLDRGKNKILEYPDFEKPFLLTTDALK